MFSKTLGDVNTDKIEMDSAFKYLIATNIFIITFIYFLKILPRSFHIRILRQILVGFAE